VPGRTKKLTATLMNKRPLGLGAKEKEHRIPSWYRPSVFSVCGKD